MALLCGFRAHLMRNGAPVRVHDDDGAHHERDQHGGDEAQAAQSAQPPQAGNEQKRHDGEDRENDRHMQGLEPPQPCSSEGQRVSIMLPTRQAISWAVYGSTLTRQEWSETGSSSTRPSMLVGLDIKCVRVALK